MTVKNVPLDQAKVDFDTRSGHRITFHGVAKCPVCTTNLALKWVLFDQWPYSHCDFQLWCPRCEWAGTFGVAANPLFGMELIIWDSRPRDVLRQVEAVPVPVCPFHTVKTRLTKIWGDKVMTPPTALRVQWKCPTCYLTAHAQIERESPYSEGVGAEEKALLTERLRAMGYM